jgi:hypothetical protein
MALPKLISVKVQQMQPNLTFNKSSIHSAAPTDHHQNLMLTLLTKHIICTINTNFKGISAIRNEDRLKY